MSDSKWPELLGGVSALAISAVLVHGWPQFPDSSAAAAWVQAVGSVIAIAAGFATLSIQRADQRKRDEEADRQSSRKFIVSVQAELSWAWSSLQSEIGHLMAHEARDILRRTTVRAAVPPFPIYENSSPEIGRLAFDADRIAVISAYSRFHGFVNAFAVHNEVIGEIKAAVAVNDDAALGHWNKQLRVQDDDIRAEYQALGDVIATVARMPPI